MSHGLIREELRRFRSAVAALGKAAAQSSGSAPIANAFPDAGVLEPAECADLVTDSDRQAHDPGIWRQIRRHSPGWLVSGILHAFLLLVLGLTALSTTQVANWASIEVGDSPQDIAGESLETFGAEDLDGITAESGAGGSSLAGSTTLNHWEPIATLPVSVDVNSAVQLRGTSIADEMNSIVGDGRDLGLGTGSRGAGGSGNAGAGGGTGAGTEGEARRSGNGYAMFYGAEARGSRFVYVVDSSESMTGLRFERACAELMSSIVGLDSRQSFFVIFFNTLEFPQFYPVVDNFLSTANGQSVDKLGQWMRNVRPMGGTNPAPALKRALELEPDAVFLLSDGEFDLRPTRYVLENSNRKRTVVHTIAFGSPIGEPMLKAIADFTGGSYRFVPLAH